MFGRSGHNLFSSCLEGHGPSQSFIFFFVSVRRVVHMYSYRVHTHDAVCHILMDWLIDWLKEMKQKWFSKSALPRIDFSKLRNRNSNGSGNQSYRSKDKPRNTQKHVVKMKKNGGGMDFSSQIHRVWLFPMDEWSFSSHNSDREDEDENHMRFCPY
mgnify:CR=1 FL=1